MKPKLAIVTSRDNSNLEHVDLVVGWLNKLEALDLDIPATGATPCSSTKAEEKDPPPVTPDRQLRETSAETEETSPTDTNFSVSPIWDSPGRGLAGEEGGAGSVYSAFSASSVDEHAGKDCDPFSQDNDGAEPCEQPCAQTSTPENTHTTLQPHLHLEAESLNSYEPPSSSSSHDDPYFRPSLASVIATQHALAASGEPINTFVTSCYQCLLANLPCSRTWPACTRCVRKGCGSVCLLHRRKFLGEMRVGDRAGNRVPVLLKVVCGEEGDGDEKKWADKVRLCEDLHQQWLDTQDRKNWILPRIPHEQCHVTGSLERHGVKERLLHPGEGLGRAMFVPLRVADYPALEEEGGEEEY